MVWILRARGFDRAWQTVMTVEADTKEEALRQISQSPNRSVLAFASRDVRLEVAERCIRRPAGECAGCDANRASGYGPPHDASPNCESGGRSHCSCDVCF